MILILKLKFGDAKFLLLFTISLQRSSPTHWSIIFSFKDTDIIKNILLTILKQKVITNTDWWLAIQFTFQVGNLFEKQKHKKYFNYEWVLQVLAQLDNLKLISDSFSILCCLDIFSNLILGTQKSASKMYRKKQTEMLNFVLKMLLISKSFPRSRKQCYL